MEKFFSASDANRNFSSILRDVTGGDRFIETSHGRPVARIVLITEDVDAARKDRINQALIARLKSQPVINVGPWTRDELHEVE